MRIAIVFLLGCFVASASPVYLIDSESWVTPFQGCTFVGINSSNVVGGWCVEAYYVGGIWDIDSPVQTWNEPGSPYDGLQYIDMYRLPFVQWSDATDWVVGIGDNGEVAVTGPFYPEYNGWPPGRDVNPADPCTFPDVACPYAVTGDFPGGNGLSGESEWLAVASLPPLVHHNDEYVLRTDSIGTYVEAVPEPNAALVTGCGLLLALVAMRFRRLPNN